MMHANTCELLLATALAASRNVRLFVRERSGQKQQTTPQSDVCQHEILRHCVHHDRTHKVRYEHWCTASSTHLEGSIEPPELQVAPTKTVPHTPNAVVCAIEVLKTRGSVSDHVFIQRQ